ncbi:hypothetical protein K523DRAFT_273341 [Schizophyllum commune Tattone D]|nr:hypothetical protein K523DRAFT_273341 [Schizophyllum commune Tattone D]
MPSRKSRGNPMRAKPSGSKPVRDQYHHVLPRFILRRYQVGPALTSAERTKALKRDGFIPEYVRFYDVATRTMTTRLIGKVYGVTNLYRDISNPDNVNHIEKKLSLLEQKAANSITVIHQAIPTGTFNISRADLGNLRKFLFIMHIRHEKRSRMYFDKDHPENAPHREFLQAYGDKHGLRTPSDLWLRYIDYLLDTPHDQIRQDGDLELPGDLGPADVDKYDKFHAVAYQQQAQMYFLGVWEAADTDEFVLTSSSFGLYEGCHMEHRGFLLHRLFVISPRVVVVLRLNLLGDPQDPAYHALRAQCSTKLIELPLTPAKTKYTRLPAAGLTDPRVFAEYVLSAAGQQDSFEMKITKLTSEQTFMVNRVTLENVPPDGSLSFASASLTVRTLRLYLRRTRIWEDRGEDYHALVEHLAPPPTRQDTPFESLMSLVLEASQSKPTHPWYWCGHEVVRNMPHLVGNRAPSDMAFAIDFGICVLSLVFHLYSKVPYGRPSVIDFLPAALPFNLSYDASTRLINAARPLLRAAAPGCACSSTSSDTNRILEAAVIVGLLEAAVADVRLRAALRSSCPTLAEYLIVRPGSQLLPKDRERIARGFNRLVIGMADEEISVPSRYERALTLQTYLVVLREADHESVVAHRDLTSSLIHTTKRVRHYGPPLSLETRPRARLRTSLSIKSGDIVMRMLSDFTSDYLQGVGDQGTLDGREAKASRWLIDAALIGLLDWMGKNRRDVVHMLLIRTGSCISDLSEIIDDQ